MNKLRSVISLAVAAAVAVVAAGWFLAVAPQRSQAAELHDQAAQQRQVSQTLKTQLSMLRAQAQLLPKQRARIAQIAAKLPSNPALPGLVRAVTAAADSAGVELVAMDPGQPAVEVPPAVAAAASGVEPTGAGTVRKAKPAATLTAGALAVIPLSLTVQGTFFELEQFQSNLESLTRAFKALNLSFTPGEQLKKPQAPGAPVTATAGEYDGQVTAVIAGQVFMTVNRAAAAGAAGTSAPVTPSAGTK